MYHKAIWKWIGHVEHRGLWWNPFDYLFLSLIICLSHTLSLSLYIYLYMNVHACLYICIYWHMYTCLSMYLPVYLFLGSFNLAICTDTQFRYGWIQLWISGSFQIIDLSVSVDLSMYTVICHFGQLCSFKMRRKRTTSSNTCWKQRFTNSHRRCGAEASGSSPELGRLVWQERYIYIYIYIYVYVCIALDNIYQRFNKYGWLLDKHKKRISQYVLLSTE